MILNLIIFGFFLLLSWLVSHQLKQRIKKYSQILLDKGLSGREVAEKMLQEHGITNVRVISTDGQLTDHYNPTDHTVNLSRDVYYGNHIAAAAIAAHECGHAVQHAQAYSWLTMRSALVPIVSFTSNWVQWVLLAGVLLVNVFPHLLLAGIVLFAILTLFSVVTLPVEIDASNRAVTWLTRSGITSYSTIPMAKDALKWAAYTYVIAVLSSLATLLYYIMIYLGRRE
jgi:Zn-dependent membrane protease YugP